MFCRLPRWFVVGCLLIHTGCGSSSTTNVTGPTQVRCAVAVSTGSASIAAAGGTGQLAVTANRECSWTATSEAAWLSVTAGATGQGDANVTFRADANPQPAPRTGSIVINQQRVEVQQAGNPCTYTLGTRSRSISHEGGRLSVSVNTQGSCAWTAMSQAGWIQIEQGSSGTGTGSVTIAVEANGGDAREGRVVIAGQTFTVMQTGVSDPPPPAPPAPDPDPDPDPNPPPSPQPPTCTFTVTPTTLNLPAQLSQGTVNVAASAASCAWTAASEATWLSVTPASGTGSGQVQFTALGNQTASPRTGTMLVAGQTVTATQAPESPNDPTCSFTVQPTNVSFTADGGNHNLQVTASAENCQWSVSSGASWIAIVGPSSGTGSGHVEISVGANTTGSSRSGTLTVAGLSVGVTQEASAACQYDVSPTEISVSALGSLGQSVSVTTGGGCTWTSTSQVSWIVITSGSSGTGSGSVELTILPYAGLTSRTGNVSVAGRTVTVRQEGLTALAGDLSQLSGTCPDLTFSVDGRVVRTTATTSFAPSCSSLSNGSEVEVQGVLQPDGTVIATRVERD